MGKGEKPYYAHQDLNNLQHLIETDRFNEVKDIVNHHGINAVDGDKRTALFWASCLGKIELLDWLLLNGADVNLQDRLGLTCLHFCAQEHQQEAAKLLLKNNADTNILNNQGNSPLWTAILHSKNNFDLVHLLVIHDSNMHYKNNQGKSPNDLAISMYKKTIIELLIQ